MASPVRRNLSSSQVEDWFGPAVIYIPSRSGAAVGVEFLVIGGGGGGGYSTGGGGGAGGYVEGYGYFPTTVGITIGAGGTGATSTAVGSNGGNSNFGEIVAFGGGGGPTGSGAGRNGGSGGGGPWPGSDSPGRATQRNPFAGYGYGNDGVSQQESTTEELAEEVLEASEQTEESTVE